MQEFCEAPIRETAALEETQFLGVERIQRAVVQPLLDLHEFLDLCQEPRVDARLLVHLRHTHA